ncbi:MAG TPA: cell division protein ZipA C-terminal FtsZ-binding domain-containing protein [Rhodocyclaceae bacterium]|nr:cell division protein ZipA C-terminal FtsZ-binding domain-containing protein [Rhodocyclaceae bacterium]
MNDLQIALLAAGSAVVAGVWGYNKWQERQHRKLAEKIFRGGQPDVLLGGESGGNAGAAAPTAEAAGRDSDESHGRIEPAVREEPVMAEVPAQQEVDGLPPLPEEYADEVADCVIRVDLVEPLPASGLWAVQSGWAGHVGKTMSWLGFDEALGAWRLLSAHDAECYTVVCAALQLADRRGAATDSDLSAFFDGVRDLAKQCSGVAEMPKRDDVLMNARGLDEFCASVDLQLGVNIVAEPDTPFAGARLRDLAEAAGLKLLEDGCFHAIDNAGMTRFTLGNIGTERFEARSMTSLATHGVTLALDVPRVADGPAVFDAMRLVAEQLTQGLNGRLVDGHGNPLTVEMIASIRAKVAELQRTMAQHQIVAGSVRALRLFS